METGKPQEVPARSARAELKVSNSRFVADIEYTPSLEDARAFLARIKAEFPDASHHVPAFVIGGEKSRTEFCSDDGEPGGTAGRPLLTVLRGSGLSDAAIVVTRYFGGSLLGTGGLVKAYSEAGKAALALAGRARLLALETLEFDLSYKAFERFRRLAEESGAELVSTSFADRVLARAELPREDLEAFLAACAGLSAGGPDPVRLGRRLARGRPAPGR